MSDELDFLLLGPLEVRRGGEPVPVPGRRRRALLAALLLRANQPVPAVDLIDSVWGAAVDRGATHALHETVSQLRRSLGDDVVATVPGGYVARVAPDRLDARRFEHALERAAREPALERRVAILHDAIGLWRGVAAAADIALEEGARHDADRLDELRLAALADLFDAELALGGEAAVLPELERAVRAHPLGERLRGQLMVALYRQGRQADALAEYQDARRRLATDLGLEPGRELRDLEQAILRHDPALARPSRPPRPARRRRRGAFALAAVAIAFAAGAVAYSSHGGTHAVWSDTLRGTEIDRGFWDTGVTGDGPVVAPGSDGVRLTIPSDAQPEDASGVMKAHLVSLCTLRVPFDIQVDYRLVNWPRWNGVLIGMYAAYADIMRKSDRSRGEMYVGTTTHFEPPDRPPNARLVTTDRRGTLRLVSDGARMQGLVRSGGRWRTVYAGRAESPFYVAVYLEIWTIAERFAHRHVDAEFSNFRVNTGDLTCPPA